jgi:hypothetical protein
MAIPNKDSLEILEIDGNPLQNINDKILKEKLSITFRNL